MSENKKLFWIGFLVSLLSFLMGLSLGSLISDKRHQRENPHELKTELIIPNNGIK